MTPFQGSFQTIAVDNAEAESTNGIDWVIYLTHESIISHTGLAEVRYGTWTLTTGLTQAKIHGVADLSAHKQCLPQLIHALETYASHAPFPLIDNYEFWLLDENKQFPLVLLDTTSTETDTNPQHYAGEWRPSQSVANSFQSEYGNFDNLTTLVNKAAGKSHRAIWYKRDNAGSGISSGNHKLTADKFPTLLVQKDSFESDDRKLIQDYFHWDAPALLQLQHLTNQQREELETYAWKQPLKVEHLHHFYPEILDKDGLEVTLVKAKLIGKSEKPDGWHEPFLPYVNE
jgi:hypothetical protein